MLCLLQATASAALQRSFTVTAGPDFASRRRVTLSGKSWAEADAEVRRPTEHSGGWSTEAEMSHPVAEWVAVGGSSRAVVWCRSGTTAEQKLSALTATATDISVAAHQAGFMQWPNGGHIERLRRATGAGDTMEARCSAWQVAGGALCARCPLSHVWLLCPWDPLALPFGAPCSCGLTFGDNWLSGCMLALHHLNGSVGALSANNDWPAQLRPGGVADKWKLVPGELRERVDTLATSGDLDSVLDVARSLLDDVLALKHQALADLLPPADGTAGLRLERYRPEYSAGLASVKGACATADAVGVSWAARNLQKLLHADLARASRPGGGSGGADAHRDDLTARGELVELCEAAGLPDPRNIWDCVAKRDMDGVLAEAEAMDSALRQHGSGAGARSSGSGEQEDEVALELGNMSQLWAD